MTHIDEPARRIPVMAETDVLVVGSGPAGLAAAIAAAREGVDTMLVERWGAFGGNITQAYVGSIAWYRYEKTLEAGGIGVELEVRAREMGATISSTLVQYLDDETLDAVAPILAAAPNPPPASDYLEPDLFKHVADRMVQEAGIRPLLHCFVANAITDGDTITGVITESKSGRQAILAKRVIDASGDADVAHFAGAPYWKAPRGELMEVSTNLGVSGVDLPKLIRYTARHPQFIRDWAKETSGKEDNELSTYLVEPFNKAKAAGEIPADVTIESFWTTATPAGEIKNLNAAHVFGIDGTDVRDLTRAEMEGRQRGIWAINALKKYASSRSRVGRFG